VLGALILGTILAVGALGYVLYPVFFGVPQEAKRVVARAEPSEREAAVAALREIEFDRATGKLSDTDYADLKRRYSQQAIDAMRREGNEPGPVTGVSDDEVEALVRAYRGGHHACPTCGPRPEPDAIYCSNCGRYLRENCAGCGASVELPDARFCVHCGNRLAA
jgi:hypothetical protein